MSRCLRAERVAQATVLAFYDPLNSKDHGLMIPERRGARQHTRKGHGLMVLERSTAAHPQGPWTHGPSKAQLRSCTPCKLIKH
jgi:hypothetical protein